MAKWLFFFCVAAFGQGEICVRNYIEGEKAACDFSTGYAHVKPLRDPEKRVCTRVYPELHCSTAPLEFVWVTSLEGTEICVMNYNQPHVVNFCEKLPQFYDYILP